VEVEMAAEAEVVVEDVKAPQVDTKPLGVVT
jgi:hypothetical protein